jgi:hypothetical protein
VSAINHDWERRTIQFGEEGAAAFRGHGQVVVESEVLSTRPHRPEAQDVALSRPKHGFESRWGRQSRNLLTICKLRRFYSSEFAAADFSTVAVFVAAALRRSAFAVTARRTSVSRTWPYRSSIRSDVQPARN